MLAFFLVSVEPFVSGSTKNGKVTTTMRRAGSAAGFINLLSYFPFVQQKTHAVASSVELLLLFFFFSSS